jgi:hypothetical protein
VIHLESLLTLSPDAFRIRLLDRLADPGYAVFPDLLRPEVASELREEMERLRSTGVFRPARIGKIEATREPEVRRDGTLWFDPAALTPIQAKLARVIEAVREDLNAGLFLGRSTENTSIVSPTTRSAPSRWFFSSIPDGRKAMAVSCSSRRATGSSTSSRSREPRSSSGAIASRTRCSRRSAIGSASRGGSEPAAPSYSM